MIELFAVLICGLVIGVGLIIFFESRRRGGK
jgi:hypothetical protein